MKIDDGGRRAAGYKGKAGDCVVRAISIATEKPYQEVYDALNELGKNERIGKRKKKRSSSRNGVYKETVKKYLESLGYTWTPTMKIGQGCKVHLRKEELPSGRLVVKVSRHLVAVIDGEVHDTHDPTRDGKRCVYGYFSNDTEELTKALATKFVFWVCPKKCKGHVTWIHTKKWSQATCEVCGEKSRLPT